jgi:hypothetical protein
MHRLIGSSRTRTELRLSGISQAWRVRGLVRTGGRQHSTEAKRSSTESASGNVYFVFPFIHRLVPVSE